MTLLALRALLKRAWSFLRRYGLIIVIGVVLVVALLTVGTSVGRGAVSRLWGLIRRERQLHEEYVDELDRITERERADRELASRRALDAVKAAEQQFRDRNQELDERKKRDIERLVRENHADPDALSRKLADQFGFVYVPSSGGTSDAP